LKEKTEGWTKEAESWPKRTRQMLRERHGDEGESVLNQVDAFVGARPALGTLLQGGLHRHPEVVDMQVERMRNPWKYQQG
jgi:hypothetical protein